MPVSVPDLPSHRSASAGLAEDAKEVRAAIRSSRSPVVVVGWSYAETVIGAAAMGESSVVRLIYVADIPNPSSVEVGDLSWIHDDPYLIVHDDGTFVLDNDWWLNEEAGTTFPPEVVDHLRRNPRRPITMAAMRARRSAARCTFPTTVLLGRTDQLVTDEERRWATDHLNDVRFLETDHFVAFRQPEAISDAVIEALNPNRARRSKADPAPRSTPWSPDRAPRPPCPLTQLVPVDAFLADRWGSTRSSTPPGAIGIAE